MARNRRFPTLGAEELQICADGLGTRQDDQIGRWNGFFRPDETEIHVWIEA